MKATKRFSTVALAATLALGMGLAARAAAFVSEVKLIGGDSSETTTLKNTLTSQGWTFIDYDLNKGASGDYIYLLYKTGDSNVGANHSFITDFYISDEGGTADDSHTLDGRTYYLVPYDGGDHFKEKKGDLNSNTGHGTANIHLYYTRDRFNDCSAVTGIVFNATSSGAVTWNGGSNPADLNSGCGSSSAYIYMHLAKTPVTYSITYTLNDGSVTGNPTSYTANTATITLKNPTRTGYRFDGWTGSNGNTPQLTVTINQGSTGNKTYTANWTINQYKATFNANGGTGGTEKTQAYGTSLTAPEVTKDGYTCTSWSPAVPATMPASNATYKAQWTANTYYVRFNKNGGSGSMSNQQFTYGVQKNLSANAFTRTGHTFSGWATRSNGAVVYANGAKVSNLTITPNGYVDLYAVWSVNKYTATFNANGGVGGTTKTQDYDSVLAAPAVTKAGYTLAGWSPAVPATVPASNSTYTAQWTANTYYVDFNSNGGNGSMSSQSFTYDVAQNLSANTFTRTGYTFAGWSTSPNGAVVYANRASVTKLTTTPYGHVTLYAVWNETPWQALQNQLSRGGTVTLTSDLTMTDNDWNLIVTNTVTLDLHGHILTNDGGSQQAIVVSTGGNLTLTNSVPGTGAITGGVRGAVINSGGVFTLNGGTITGVGDEGVSLNGGTFTMNGGAITGVGDEGVCMNGGTFTLNGGAITGNAGYGVYMSGNGAFTLNGGAISNNNGGVRANNIGGAFTLNGGAITGNNGFGVEWQSPGAFTVSGSPVVTGNNPGGTACNIHLVSDYQSSGKTISVNGLSAGASLGVTIDTTPTDGNPVVITSGAAPGDSAYFLSDNSACYVNMVASGEVCIRGPMTWSELQAALAEGGAVTLLNDVHDNAGLGSLRITKTVTLDLNGHTISGASYYHYALIEVAEGGNLTLTNSVPEAGAITDGYRGVLVNQDSTFTMNGGAISGIAANISGGGVWVYHGTFTMNGGTISGNTVYTGGGVDVYYSTFTMNGGTISGNAATSHGGGVYVEGGTFTMNGGEISDNRDSGVGGGVEVSSIAGGTIALNGGTITNNIGGVNVGSGTMTVSGSPVVAGNTNSAGVAVNVYLPGGKTISAGGLSAGASLGVTTEAAPAAFSPVAVATNASPSAVACFSSDRPGFFLELDGDGVLRLKAPLTWADLQAALDAGGNITLPADCTAASGDEGLVIHGKNVRLDLNGHTIGGCDDSVVFVHDGTFTLTNSVEGAGAIADGEIGVIVGMNGAFTMEGGAITDNHSYNGCGVYVSEGGTFTMNGGAITNNFAVYDGGGVYVDDGGSFTMKGGEIADNLAGFYGGGVFVKDGGAFTMSGGEISGNNAEDNGGGVYVCEGSTMSVSGSPVVSGNTNYATGAADNVYLPGGKTITVGTLAAGASIGVTTEVAPTAFSPVTITSGASAGDESRFFSDVPGGFVDMRGGEVCFGVSLTWAALQAALDAGGTVTLPESVAASDIDESLVVTNAVVLDLTGCTITGNDNDDVICVLAGGSLTLTNSVPETGSITCGDVWVDGGTFTMNGGVIAGCDYAGVFVSYAGSVFIMNGGAITNNGDCGVCVYGGAFTMNGGTVADNVNQGVYVYGAGSFAMNGGVVTKNGAGSGGGVCGGVYVEPACTMSVSGSPVIFGNGNSAGGAYNVWLSDGMAIAVGNLAPGAVIGVTTEVEPSVNSPVVVTSGASTGDSRYFLSDNPDFVTAEKDGEVCVRPISSPWDALQVELNKGGTVTLADDVVATSGDGPLTVSCAVVLDLNGHTLDAAGMGIRVIEIRSGGDLVLSNSVATGVLTGGSADCGGGVHVASGGAFTISGRLVISGNTNSVGAAANVWLPSGQTIAVNGLLAGSSIGVTAEAAPLPGSPVTITSGGASGDFLHFSSDDSAIFLYEENGEVCLTAQQPSSWATLQHRLNAGGVVVLSGNVTAADGDATLTVRNAVTLDLAGHTLDAGGRFEAIDIRKGGDLTLTNSVEEAGMITGARTISGAVHVYGGIFTMSGGTITGNESQNGSVYVSFRGTFRMTGGEISGNTSTAWGGGVNVEGDGTSFTMTGGVISDNTAIFGGGVSVGYSGTFTMSGGTITGNAAEEDGAGVFVYQKGVFSVSGTPVVSGNTNTLGGAQNVCCIDDIYIAVGDLAEGASIGVTPYRTPTVGNPEVFATGASSGDDSYLFSDRGYIVEIADGSARFVVPSTPWWSLQGLLDAGGTVALTDDLTAMPYDTSLTVTNAVTLDLAGHTLDAAGHFGVVRVESGGSLTLTNSVPETGAITGGFAQEGGGVHVGGNAAFTMAGAEISGNCAGYGGGVYVDGGATFTVQGRPVVSGNTNSVGAASNVWLPDGQTIAANGLSAGASLGVTTEIAPEDGIPVAFATGTAAGDARYFFGDDSDLFIYEMNDELLFMTQPPSPWKTLQYRLNAGGTVTLTNNVAAADDDDSLVVTNSVLLDLNGFTITGNGDYAVISIEEGGHLTLTNGADEVAAITGTDSGVAVNWNGTFTMNGGAISGCDSGVCVYGGTFTMNGGAISGCRCGVYVAGTFTMNGGEISDTDAYGGVYVDYDSTFTMNGGAISGNTTEYGGGVYVESEATFTMNGGTISGNTAEYSGGGVYVEFDATFTMNDGTISGNQAGECGGGVYEYGMFTMNGGTITGNCAVLGGGVSLFGRVMAVAENPVVSGNTNFLGEANNICLVPGSVFNVEEFSAGASIGVSIISNPGVFDTLAITEGAVAGDSQYFFSDSPGIIVDERNGEVCFTASRTPWLALQAQLDQGGTVTLTNDFSAQAYDIPLLVTNTVLLDLAGHTLVGARYDAVIYIYDGGALTLTNSVEGLGSITGGGYGGVYVGENGTFTMVGGAISGNTAEYGGGVYVEDGTFTMNGGAISGNTAEYGGGVYVYRNGAFTVSGRPVVSGNTNSVGEASNVYLPGGNTIAVNGLSAGASIGVSTEYEPEDGYPVAISADATAAAAAYFFSDDPGCHVEMVNGELCLVAGMDVPAYLVGADEIVIANYAAWAAKYGPDTAGTHRDAFLLNIDPATPIPPGAALLKIVEFRFTATSMYIELASDVTQFEENGTGMLGNGFLAFRSALSLSPDPDDWETVGPFPVVFRNGHAIYSYDDQEINGENSVPLEGEGAPLEGEIGLEPEDPMPRPSSFFFKAILTDRVNTVVY